jgi:IS5 family transposase
VRGSRLYASNARRLRVDFGVNPLIAKPNPQPPEPTRRQERTVQASLFDLFAGHEIGRELKAMSAWLDDPRELAGLVAADLRRYGAKATGRQGLPAEAVLRCAVLKQHRQLSYQELAFHLEDSASFRAFARLPHGWTPQKSVLHQTIRAIRAETWEQINRTLLTSARETRLERGRVVRLDSTVTTAPMHEPSDSSLLGDAVRVMMRLLKETNAWAGRADLWWRDHRRAAKKRARNIQFTRGRPRRLQLYRELITTTRATLAYLRQAAGQLATRTGLAADPGVALWQAKVDHYRPLIERIITQSERRVLAGEAVPARHANQLKPRCFWTGTNLVSTVAGGSRGRSDVRPRNRDWRPRAHNRLQGADDPLLRGDRADARAGADGWQPAPLRPAARRPLGIYPAQPRARLLARGDPRAAQPVRSSGAAVRCRRSARAAPARAVEQRLTRLSVLKAELERMIEQCAGGRVRDCRIIEALSTHAH